MIKNINQTIILNIITLLNSNLNYNNNKHNEFDYTFSYFSGIKDDNTSNEITLFYIFPQGEGIVSTTNSTLIKPFNDIINDGRPIEKLAYLLYYEKNNNSYYFLGTFIITTKKRLLFFPAINISKITLEGGKELNDSYFI